MSSGRILGGTSPTQPFPTKPPPFERQGVTEDDVIDLTPELREEALAIMNQYVSGPFFTPPALYGDRGKKGALSLPGGGGGANWVGAAVDPETGVLYDLRAFDKRTGETLWKQQLDLAPHGAPMTYMAAGGNTSW